MERVECAVYPTSVVLQRHLDGDVLCEVLVRKTLFRDHLVQRSRGRTLGPPCRQRRAGLRVGPVLEFFENDSCGVSRSRKLNWPDPLSHSPPLMVIFPVDVARGLAGAPRRDVSSFFMNACVLSGSSRSRPVAPWVVRSRTSTAPTDDKHLALSAPAPAGVTASSSVRPWHGAGWCEQREPATPAAEVSNGIGGDEFHIGLSLRSSWRWH